MRWLAKAAVQKTIGHLPRGERVNYVFQRHLLRTLPQTDTGFRQKAQRALEHLRAYDEHGPGRPLAEAVYFEFGAGWDLAVPLIFAAAGVGRQILVDINPSARLELAADSLRKLARQRQSLAQDAGRPLRDLDEPPLRTVDDLRAFGIEYLAPRDARATGLAPGSVDFVSSTDTLEHVPRDDLLAILRECRRLLEPSGVLSSRVDMQDHYSYFDGSVSRYGFLRYPERTWRLFNSPIHYQNRLRYPDYLSLLDEAGFDVVEQHPSRPDERDLELLRVLPLAPEFRGYEVEDLGVKTLRFVARPRT